MAKPRRLPKKTIVTIEGEKAATRTTGCRNRGSVIFRHRQCDLSASLSSRGGARRDLSVTFGLSAPSGRMLRFLDALLQQLSNGGIGWKQRQQCLPALRRGRLVAGGKGGGTEIEQRQRVAGGGLLQPPEHGN